MVLKPLKDQFSTDGDSSSLAAQAELYSSIFNIWSSLEFVSEEEQP